MTPFFVAPGDFVSAQENQKTELVEMGGLSDDKEENQLSDTQGKIFNLRKVGNIYKNKVWLYLDSKGSDKCCHVDADKGLNRFSGFFLQIHRLTIQTLHPENAAEFI